ncbi:MAG: GW dipeptide domain-containing protein [Aureibaculum sp.]|nr:GW dipeptide domain-containing protein [Aureibaculum sp.]
MILKHKLPVIFIMAILLAISCKKEPEYKPLSTGHKNSGQSSGMFSNESANPSSTNESLSNELHTVIVKEVLKATRYEYLKVEEGKELFWIAVRKQDVKIGETYYYKRALLKTNFESKEHNKLFEKIYLVTNLVQADNHGNDNGVTTKIASSEKKINDSEPDQKVTKNKTKIEQKGSITIAELVENYKKYEGKTVQISGKCVKVNANIMGRNWIHLKDGSKDDYDLVITSDTFVAEGTMITVKATVSLNKDFGAGYQYNLILENGVIVP